ncbi:MAG TPA: ArsR family transcriptional regulator [bacterium]|nr:ArsR family transcriptional regulator [bacterium]
MTPCSERSSIRRAEKLSACCAAVGEIAENFRTSRPAISKHLRVLRSAGSLLHAEMAPRAFAP